jgi:hypothetical protein
MATNDKPKAPKQQCDTKNSSIVTLQKTVYAALLVAAMCGLFQSCNPKDDLPTDLDTTSPIGTTKTTTTDTPAVIPEAEPVAESSTIQKAFKALIIDILGLKLTTPVNTSIPNITMKSAPLVKGDVEHIRYHDEFDAKTYNLTYNEEESSDSTMVFDGMRQSDYSTKAYDIRQKFTIVEDGVEREVFSKNSNGEYVKNGGSKITLTDDGKVKESGIFDIIYEKDTEDSLTMIYPDGSRGKMDNILIMTKE